MSLFNAIFESVINEVKSDDAYNRFYSSMPREDFDKITGGAPEIDKFVQFLLNSVRDGLSTVDEAAQANEEFKAADPLIRQNILNAFRNGEYETANEVLINLQYLKEGGFINKNKFAKEGYIKVAEDDNWLCTCTTNYMANNHYFGHTKWCTASDRMGRYDGYLMYKRYGHDGNSLLIQFTRKGTKDETYQAEIDFLEQGEIYVNTICNIQDDSISLNDLKMKVGNLVNDVLEDTDKLKKLVEIQKKQKVHEDKYQEKQTKIINEKRKREEERLRRRCEEVNAEVERLNAPINEKANRAWQEAERSKIYEDIEFLNKLLQLRYDMENTYQSNYEETIKESRGLIICDTCGHCYDGTQYRIMTLEIGVAAREYFAREVYNDDDVVTDYEVAIEEEYIEMKAKRFVITEYRDEKIVKIITSIRHGDGYTFSPWTVQSKMPAYNDRFLIDFFHFNDDEGREIVKSFLFDLKTGNAINYDEGCELNWPDDYAPKRIFPLPNGDTMFTSYSRISKHPIGVLLLKSDGSFEFYHDDKETERFLIDEDRCLLYDSVTRNLIRNDYSEIRYGTIPGDDKIYSIYRAIHPGNSLVYIYSGDKENIFDMETGEYVFGMWGEDMSQEWDTNKFLGVFIDKKGNRIRIRYDKDTNEYRLIRINRKACDMVCDKYGENEEERKKRELGDYNMKKYWKGYSPEQQAQMDKMWADRQGKENDGSEAMKAWNDDDASTVSTKDGYTYGDFFQKIDPHSDDENWGRNQWGDRLVGLRDPEEFFKTYMSDDWDDPHAYRPGQTYRIGKNGKPLDQPWRDEDEVPARFTDDSLNESVKKVITLMNKLIKD